MKTVSLAGALAFATLGAQAQVSPGTHPQSLHPVLVTATRGLEAVTTLREATVITREDLYQAGSLTLAEVLLRRVGIDFRATGGPGQPVSLYVRGASSPQTLVLIDGIRVGSAIVGATSVENIPLDMIERIEVVKGPLSSLYGSDAIGGVVQVFTRAKNVPHLHASAGFGSDGDWRGAAGVTGADKSTTFSLAAGYRQVDAKSATNARVPFESHDPDRDPYENVFAQGSFTHKLWQGEQVAVNVFASRGKTAFDSGVDAAGRGFGDRNDQVLSGASVSSSSRFGNGWDSRMTLAHGRDEIDIRGRFPSSFATRQDQASWVNEFTASVGKAIAGIEWLRQGASSDESAGAFARSRRETWSAFAGYSEVRRGHRVEASARVDDDDQYGRRTTGSASYGIEWTGLGLLSATYGQGFRAPTLFDAFGPSFPGFETNPNLRPERSRSVEVSLRSDARARLQWRLTGFDNRIEDLILYVYPGMTNLGRVRIRGAEATAEASWLGARWRANATVQRPRDEDTGAALANRARRFGSLDITRDFGAWQAGVTIVASGARSDPNFADPAASAAGFATADARLKYSIGKRWHIEATATNLLDRKYETAVGYNAPRRGLFVQVRFEAF